MFKHDTLQLDAKPELSSCFVHFNCVNELFGNAILLIIGL